MKTLRLLGLAGACVGVLLASTAHSAIGDDDVEMARYKFREPLVNGRGISRLEELRGTPVLIEYWGTR